MTSKSPFRFAAILVCGALWAACQSPSSTSNDYLVYTDNAAVILEGHDVVALKVERRLVRGTAEHVARYHGATYRFASAANRDAFEDRPESFAPQFGGHCAMSMAMNKLEPGDVTTWSYVDDRLVVQRNARAKGMWSKDPRGNLKKADGNWPGMLQRHGKRG